MPQIRSLFFLIAVLLCATLALVPSVGYAQWGANIKHPVSMTARFEPAEAKAGEVVNLILTATVSPEYHIYSMTQESQGGPIPTEVKLTGEWEGLLEPRGEWIEPANVQTKYDKGFEMNVRVIYGSPLTFKREFVVKQGAALGAATVDGHLFVQACTEESCLPPAKRTFKTTLTVLEGSVEPPAATPIATPVPSVTETPAASTTPPVQTTGSLDEELAGRSFLGFLATAFLLGLVALATPCVFPMIPITVSFFTKTKSASTGHAILNASVYTISIIVGFALVGFAVSMALRLMGAGVESSGFANQLASNPWVNIFFAVLYLVFALSLFELIHLALPSSITNKLNRAATGRTDFFGIAMKALVFVLISFTCTAPLIGILIVQTLDGEWTRPLFGMMAFSTGFALPFFVLALVPQMLASLPKAGSWLYATKVVMGLLVIAAAFKFISNADLVLFREQMILTRELLLAIWAGIAAVTAFYLFGFIRLPDDDSGVVSVPRMLTGTFFGIMFVYLAAGLTGTKLHSWVEAYLPPDFSPVIASAGAGASPEQMEWLKDRDKAMALAKETGKPVFIDFTGWSCTNCRLMEKNMFPRPAVAERLGDFVRVKLYTDDRTELPDGKTVGEVNLAYQADTFKTVTLPFYVVMSPDGKVLGQAEYTTDEGKFTAFLDRGLSWKEVANAE